LGKELDMNMRCAFCQNPYAIGRNEMLSALQKMEAENLSHYDAHCPRCRRVTQIPRQKLELANPNWKASLEAAASPEPAPEPAPKADPTPAAKPAARKSAKK
jgi:phage FluMu protein Com